VETYCLIKTPVAIQPHYTIYFERYDGVTWTHADVHKWTPSIAREFKDIHALLNIIHNEPFYCLVDNSKLEKFVKQIGYQYLQDAECVDGVNRRIYQWVAS
jgi:hypothetical protein